MARQDFINAEELIQRLNDSFIKHRIIIDQNAEAMGKLQAQYKKLPSDYLNTQRQIQDSMAKQTVLENNLIDLEQKSIKTKSKANSERVAELKLQKQREDAFDKYEAQLKKEASALARSESIYNKVQAKVRALSLEYNDIAAKKELGLKLSTREEAQLLSLTNRLNKYQGVLKTVDANIGKHQRNVGNYASGFNGLSHSINQLTREAPAFAVSMNTGFLALSNNIPMLFDEINKIKTANAELIKQGEPIKSVFSQMGSAIFSWGTAISLGVTLLTLYGDEIIEWGSNIFKGTKAIDAAKESAEALNSIRTESLKSIVKERQELQNNLAVAQNTTLSYKDRGIAAQKILDQYPYWFENLGKEAIMNGNVQKAIEGVNNALLARAKANAALSKITENQGKVIDADQKRIDLVEELAKAEDKLRTVQRRSYAASNAENQAQSEAEALGKVQNLKLQISKVDQELIALNEINNRLTAYSITETEKAIGLDYRKAEASKKAKEEEIQAETNSRVAFERNISTLEEKLALMNKENAAYGALSLQLKILKDAYEALYGEQEKLNEETEKTIKYGTEEYYNDVINKLKAEQSALADTSEQYQVYNSMIKTVQNQLDALTGKKDEVEALNSAVQDYLKGFSSGFLQDAGLNSLNFFLQLDENGKSAFDNLMEKAETTKEKFAVTFNAIAEVAQEAFAFINQASKASFQAQYDDLAQRQEVALKYAGESQAAQEEINRQYEERRKEIKRKELKAQKEQAIFNAIINTAQGVTAALGQANIPLSIIIAALGAAQIAFIAGQQIPAYFKGTDNHPGGLMMVNDAKGGNYKEVIETPDGNTYTPQGRNVLMNAPKGTKVHKSYADFESKLNSILTENSIAPFADVLMRDRFGGVVINQGGGGITKEEMAQLMSKYQNKDTFHLNLDRRGINTYWKGRDSINTEIANSINIKR